MLIAAPGVFDCWEGGAVDNMDREHVAEWSRLMDQALAAVRRGADLRERAATRLFQIVVVPAFEAAASWELFESRTRGKVTSHEIIVTAWDQTADSEKFQSPIERLKHGPRLEPSLRSDRVRTSAEDSATLLVALDRIHIPVAPGEHPIGCDGTLYHFETGDPFCGSAFGWWEDGPPAWAPLVDAVRKVHALLEKLAPSRVPRE